MTTPAGNPPWTRTAGIADYGGATDKENYLAKGVVDPRTDVGAAEIMRLASDLAAMTRVAPFCVINYTADDTGTADPDVNWCVMQTQIDTDGWAAGATPTGFPVLARTGDGVVTITFASSYSDDYSVSGSFTVHAAEGCSNANASLAVDCELTSATVVTASVYNSAAGTAATDKTVTVSVW